MNAAQKADASVYSHARHIAEVQRAAREAGVKGAAFAVLSYLCSAADFRRPTVCVSKATICARTGYHWDTVRIALRDLRDLGMIVPVAYETGGKARATVYSLKAKGSYGAENPPGMPDQAIGGGKSSRYGVENPVDRGRKIHPPSVSSSDASSGMKGGASRAGPSPAGLDGGASAARPAAPLDAEELRRFSRDVTEHGYGEARRRQAAREAERAKGAMNGEGGGGNA